MFGRLALDLLVFAVLGNGGIVAFALQWFADEDGGADGCKRVGNISVGEVSMCVMENLPLWHVTMINVRATAVRTRVQLELSAVILNV